MPRHVEAYLDGLALRDAAPKVWIKQITEEIGALDASTAVFPGTDGERLLGPPRRRSLTVTIAATIHEVYDLTYRAQAQDAIAAWMGRGGVLTVSYRPDKRLRVAPGAVPALGKVRDYTQEITMKLTAYAVPYWEDVDARTWTYEADDDGEDEIAITGARETPLQALIVPSAELDTFTLQVGDDFITLADLNLASGKALVIGRTTDDFLTITADGVGILNKRTAASSDDLLLRPGANTVSWTADATCAVTLSARGRYE